MWWAFYSNRQRAFRVSYGAKLIRRGDEDSSAQWRGAVIGQWVIESWSISSTLQVRFQKSNAPTKKFSTTYNFCRAANSGSLKLTSRLNLSIWTPTCFWDPPKSVIGVGDFRGFGQKSILCLFDFWDVQKVTFWTPNLSKRGVLGGFGVKKGGFRGFGVTKGGFRGFSGVLGVFRALGRPKQVKKPGFWGPKSTF